jgi:hypothetical protein
VSSLADIIGELAATIENVTDSSDYEIAVYPGMLFNPTTTAIDIYPDEPFRDEATAGMGDIDGGYRFVVRARTGLNDLDAGQSILLALMDDFDDICLAAAVSDDPTLNGMASDVFVSGPSGFRPFRDLGGEGTMAGVVWNVLVLAAQS